MPKCRQCGKDVAKAAAIEVKPKFFVCSEQCRHDWLYDHRPQDGKADMRKLTDYVNSYAPCTDWIVFIANVKRMCKEYGMTPSGIRYTLWYIKCKTGTPIYDSGLGLVPYYYTQAKDYYNWRQAMERQVAQWRLDDSNVTIRKHETERDVFI